jgi:hypothetical protein
VSSRKLLQGGSAPAKEQGANKAGEHVVTVSSDRPLSADLPAADSQATMTKSVRKDGPDGNPVECTLISVPDQAKKTVHDQYVVAPAVDCACCAEKTCGAYSSWMCICATADAKLERVA